MGLIVQFRIHERTVIDTALLDRLCRRMGARGAEGFVAERVEEIADRLADIDWLHRQGQTHQVPTEAQRVARLCADVGLTSLGRAARDLAQTATQGDGAAFAAVWDRVVRIGDRSLAQVWDAPGLSV